MLIFLSYNFNCGSLRVDLDMNTMMMEVVKQSLSVTCATLNSTQRQF